MIETLHEIANTLVLPLLLLAGQLWLNSKFTESTRRRDEKEAAQAERHREEKEWRDTVTARLDTSDRRIGMLMDAQANVMRSDIIHKAHRYLDDNGCASTAEKESMHEMWTAYCEFCTENDIVNSFVDELVQQVMQLPNRTKED